MKWDKDKTEEWLTLNPLPPDFEWQGKQVLPSYKIHKGYGFWLRTTPYHRGLFERCNDLLTARNGQYSDALELAEDLLQKPHQQDTEFLPGLGI
jgi:hypothetical protein